jgi:hypothetical protein
VPLEATYRPPVRGVVAPELHYIKQNWHLCFSMDGEGTGLVKSTSGQPGDVTIVVKMAPYTERELRVRGGGEIAEIKTVSETLP